MRDGMDRGLDLYDDRLPYDWHLIPDLDGKHGYLTVFTTHAICDGVQFLPTTMLMSDNMDMSKMRYVAKPSLMQRILA